MASLIKSTNGQSIFEKMKNSSPAKLLADSSRRDVGRLLVNSLPTVGQETFWEALLYFKLSLTQFV